MTAPDHEPGDGHACRLRKLDKSTSKWIPEPIQRQAAKYVSILLEKYNGKLTGDKVI